jgi:hypothetical protein
LAYSGWLLSDSERSRLLALIPGKYPDVIAHHITLEHGSPKKLILPPDVSAVIVGYADDGVGVEAIIVRIDGTTTRPTGGVYHITWSLDRAAGAKPADSNRVITLNGWVPLVTTVPITVEPLIFL